MAIKTRKNYAAEDKVAVDGVIDGSPKVAQSPVAPLLIICNGPERLDWLGHYQKKWDKRNWNCSCSRCPPRPHLASDFRRIGQSSTWN